MKTASRLPLPALGAVLLSLGCGAPAAAQPDERCYPGPPMYILRELLGGVYTPERYRQAVLDYARSRCTDGQVLKLVSPAGPDEHDRLNEAIALELCDPETLAREASGAGERAILTFCRISKLQARED